MFHALGETYQERQLNDTGKYMQNMAIALGNLGILVPSLARPLDVDGPQIALEASAQDLISGASLSDLAVARIAVNQHWCDTIATASDVMQASVTNLASSIAPSWKANLEPTASWQDLIDTCGDTLGTTDADAIMACHNLAKKARSGIS